MLKNCVGVDIGAYELKLCVKTGDKYMFYREPVPDNIVKNDRVSAPAAMSEVLKQAFKKYHISCRNCAVSLPSSLVFSRQVTLPYMTAEHLKINLPYEFRDFITAEKEKYFYDYVVNKVTEDENGTPVSMDVMAAAIPKAVITEYLYMFRRAGLKLTVAIPEEFAYRNLIMQAEEAAFAVRAGAEPPLPEPEQPEEYCFLDLGHTATRLFIFVGEKLEASRTIPYGSSILDEAIADARNIDRHIASQHKLADFENAQTIDSCMAVYSHIAVEISRALSFYNFSNPNNNLSKLYYCGGGSLIPEQLKAVRDAVSVGIFDVTNLLPEAQKQIKDISVAALALGVTLQ